MELTLTTSELQRVMRIASRAISSSAAVPAFGGVLIEAGGESVRARATDTETSLTVSVDAQASTEGSVLLPGRLLTDLAGSLPAGNASLKARASERDVELQAGSATFHLRTLSQDEFPTLPAPAAEGGASLPAEPLAEAIERVQRAASRDEVRPILTGILLSGEGEKLTLVATDSYRLSVNHMSLSEPLAESLEANVPAAALRELGRLIGQESLERISVSLDGGQAIFDAGSAVLTTRLIDGQFPSYRQLIPESFEHEIKLATAELLDVTKRVRYLAQKTAPIRLTFREGELVVSAETTDVGDASEAMPAPGFSGEELTMSFNPRFLVDGIESIATEELLLKMSSPLRPGLLQPAGDEDFAYLVMPIRPND